LLYLTTCVDFSIGDNNGERGGVDKGDDGRSNCGIWCVVPVQVYMVYAMVIVNICAVTVCFRMQNGVFRYGVVRRSRWSKKSSRLSQTVLAIEVKGDAVVVVLAVEVPVVKFVSAHNGVIKDSRRSSVYASRFATGVCGFCNSEGQEWEFESIMPLQRVSAGSLSMEVKRETNSSRWKFNTLAMEVSV